MPPFQPRHSRLLAGSALAALSIAGAAVPARAVVPNETTTPTEIVDTTDEFRGVGMFFRADGFVCTGTLINPRTVLFAAHCVNNRPATDYNPDDVPAAWSFNVNALPGFQNWIANNFTSNPDLAVFNVNRIFWNPRSTGAAGGLNFIEADIALASLDTPAAGIPTWALLFSTLPAPATIDPVSGTGYHVEIVGYGRSGNATQGAVLGVDWRRRAAENMLGGFFSLDDRDNVLFGPDAPTFPQNLYQLDFDSQNRDFTRDINVFRDDALPNEGTTAGGDSGGPLILDAANNTLSNEDLVIGVLSGGSRFFSTQPFSSIGTTSFYQPLSLYWQYITATNPYRYVGARAGNGNWEDANHWVTLLDPAYRIIAANGQVVNGLPTTPELGTNGTGSDFGAICIEFETPEDFCTDLASAANPAAGALPAPTLANGLPGATGFVPNNIDPVVSADPGINVDPRYFDVTLGQTGTTTLNSDVTIDRLTVRGAAGLTVNTAGNLTSLIDVNQFGGRVNINGGITSIGDYTLFAGMLEGTGTITAPFLTSITGVFSPGTMGTTGTLNIDGNLVMSSGSTFLVDIGANGVSDRLAVNGLANIGGVVSIGSAITQQVNGQGQRYTILTASDGVSGTFTTRALSSILSQTFVYEPNAVLMEITAASYNTVIDANDPAQAAYAQLWDQNRPNGALASLYGLDFADATTIRSTFRSLAPVNEQAVRSLAGQSINLLQNFNDARLRESDRNKAGGTIAVKGAPLGALEASLSPMRQPLGDTMMAFQSSGDDAVVTQANLPEDMAIFLSGGFVTGDIGSLPGFATQSDMSGLLIAGGIEVYPGERTMVGVSGFFSGLDADTPLGQRVDSDTYAASLYLRHAFEGGPVIDGQISMGSMGFDTSRQVEFLGATQTLESASDDRIVSGALGLSYDLESGIGTISPGIEVRYAKVDLTTARETGGTLALAAARESFTSSQARFGLDYQKEGQQVAIRANAHLVWELEDGPQLLAANFAQGIGPNANFVLETADHTWGEVGIAANFGTGPLKVSAGFETTIGRDNADTQVLRATATYRF
ncbi:autotransporter domain-containing protein [Porphyrobacter sp. LM 6]|uniref:autotransporter domain-containing protein n=1 Tax=Porphyrobacter sp. LM 6 TaxID=1896196 RepID=UPI0008467639|nr:autotransporter domain-containing protein [Porphyrobacter sp. LM 6]AOL94197.1 C-terminal beta-barrel porin protein [Porphyrobacter sp. LM 6]